MAWVSTEELMGVFTSYLDQQVCYDLSQVSHYFTILAVFGEGLQGKLTGFTLCYAKPIMHFLALCV